MVTPWNADNRTKGRDNSESVPGTAANTLPRGPSIQFEKLLGIALWAGFAGVLLWIAGA
jgi:hypothetical protein